MKLVRFVAGYTNVFILVNGSNSVLVDTGKRGQSLRILERMGSLGLRPTDLALIVMTHTHFDHSGSLAELKRLTEARIVVHQSEAAYLQEGYTPIPKGTNPVTNAIAHLGRLLYPSLAAYEAVKPDILVDEQLSLAPWGIDGYVLHTPGHTEGSQSLILNGQAIISGDCFFSVTPRSVFTPYTNDVPLLLKSWDKLFNLNIDTIHCGHGPGFSRQRGLNCYQKLIKKNRKIWHDKP